MRSTLLAGFFLVATAIVGPALSEGAAPPSDPSGTAPKVDAQSYREAVARALKYLETSAQAPDGSYSAYAGPGITALVTTGVLRQGRSADDPMVAKSLKYLEGFVQPDGGIYTKGMFHRNYETSLALMCFVAANRNGRYDKLIDHAEKFLKGIQWDEDEGPRQDESQLRRGGVR